MSFCGEDTAFYRKVLIGYVEAFPRKKAELDQCYENADWHEFEIMVHALKSTSKTIGATALSEEAFSLEEAAGRENADFIRDAYPGFIQKYQEIVQAIAEITE